ncbi:MAG: ATP-binding protein [Labilithrix sp.]
MRGSVQAKVFAVIALVAVSLVLGLTAYFSRRQEVATRHELDERLRVYVALASHELEPAIALGDERSAREIFDVLAVADELSAVAVYRADGTLIASRGRLGAPSVVRRTQRVRSRDGVSGTIVLELSTRISDAEISAANGSAVAVAVLALVLGLGGAWLIARHLSNRIGAVASAASKIAESEATAAAPIVVDEEDDIGRLSGSFNRMVSRLLAAQSQEISLLLAHVAKGFVIVDREGKLGAHHSAVMDRWFGDAVKKGVPLWSLFRDDGRTASHLELAWEGLFEEFLPTEVALDQFPKRLRHGPRTLELIVHPIRSEEGALDRALVTLADVTDALLRDESDAMRSDLVTLCERAVADRSSVIDFVNEGDSIHRAIEIGETLGDLRQAVHTMKGVAAQTGAAHIAQACQAIEQGMAESEDGKPRPADIAALSTRWYALTSRLRILFAGAEPTLRVTRGDIDSLVASIASFEPHALLARKARMLALEPMQVRLDRIKEAARALGMRLGKEVEVTGSAYGLRCDPATWTPFWSAFTHVVRNALDHGIEGADVRIAHGKSPAGHLSIDVVRRQDSVVVEVMEDGAGIDWDAVAQKAQALGLPAASRRDLEEALFADGLTTREHATELSGRGLGLASVRAITERMGGRIGVVSMRGVGTTIRFTFPAAALGVTYSEEDARVAA